MDYYPGSSAKRAAFLRDFPDADLIKSAHPDRQGESGSNGGPACVPWAFKTGLTEDTVRGGVENWCGVLQEASDDA